MATESLTFKIGADTAAFRNQMAAAIKTLGGLTAAFVSVRAVVDSFAKAIDMGGRLNDLSSRTGETAGNLALLERAFNNAGAGAEKVGPAINKMQKSIQDAADGTAEAVDSLAMLGLTAADLAGRLPIEQMQIISDRINGISDPTQRAAAAMGVFGKSGGELLPLLRNFSGELEVASGQLGSLPEILDKANFAFDSVGDSMAAVSAKGTEMAAGFLSEVIPAIEAVTGKLANLDAAGAGAHLGKGFKAIIKDFGDSLSAIMLFEFGRIKDFGNEIISAVSHAVKFAENFFSLAGKTLLPNIIDILYGGIRMVGSEFNRLLIDASLNFINALSGVFPQLQNAVQPLIEADSKMILASALGSAQMKSGAQAIVDAFNLAKNITPYIRNDILGAYETYQKAEEAAKRALASGGDNLSQAVADGFTKAIIDSLDASGGAFAGMLKNGPITTPIISAKTGGGGGGAESRIPDDYFNQELFGPQIKRQERATSIKGAQYDNSYKSSTDLTTGDLVDSWNPYGSAVNEMLKKGEKGGESMEENGDVKGKQAAQDGKGENRANTIAAAMGRIEGILAKLEPKLPQHITS